MKKNMIDLSARIAVVCASALFFITMVPCHMLAQDTDGVFTIYLVRHAEKQSDTNDPPLTECGVERSESLSVLLDAVPLEAVFSTDYKRTQSTALPTALEQGLKIESYAPGDLKGIADQLLMNRQDALVVGHSNTTAVLAGLLIGEEMGSFDESIYNRVYQVVIAGDDRRLHILHTAFVCPSH
jgi:broad specificity phosphatase PhoE